MTDNKALIRRYYAELWNRWDAGAIDEIIAPDIEFRGSIVAEGDQVVARLTYTGTHASPLFGIAGSGRRVRYDGIAIFTIRGAKIVRAFVLGDVDGLKRQLSGFPS